MRFGCGVQVAPVSVLVAIWPFAVAITMSLLVGPRSEQGRNGWGQALPGAAVVGAVRSPVSVVASSAPVCGDAARCGGSR